MLKLLHLIQYERADDNPLTIVSCFVIGHRAGMCSICWDATWSQPR